MSSIPLTIYVPAMLGAKIRRAAEQAKQSQSAYVVALLKQHFMESPTSSAATIPVPISTQKFGAADPLPTLIIAQLAHLSAVAEEWIELLPDAHHMAAKYRIEERSKKYKEAAQKRLKA
jgi:hypothetical protein